MLHSENQLLAKNSGCIRGSCATVYLDLLLKMWRDNLTISRAPSYTEVYELKPRRIIILASSTTIPEPIVDHHVNTVKTTTFVSDALETVENPDMTNSDDIFDSIDLSGVHDLKDLIERPVRLQAGTFTSSDNTRLYSSDPFVALMSAWSTKLDRAQLVHADIELTLQVNAMRFQAGRYILAFLPSFGADTTSTNFAAYDKMHAAVLSQITTLPHVEIDLAYDTSVSLVVPWRSVVAAWPNQSVISHKVGFGKAILFPYWPMIPESTAATCGYTLYARFINASISAPTVAQSGTEVEQKKAGIGPVSGFFGKVSKATGILSQVPVIGSYLKPMSWVSGLLGQAASVFGWSKPPVLNAPTLFQTRKLGYVEVSDGASTARPLGGFSTNAVQPTGIGKTPVEDEMALSFLLSKPAYYTNATWTTVQTAGTSVLTLGTIPANYLTSYATGGVYLPFSFPVTLFRKYRGGLKFKFKLVKNEFYSGRIGAFFQPLETGGVLATATSDLALGYQRTIIDIRTTREFEIEIPFISVHPYKNIDEGFGNLVLYVVDPLVCPDNMAGTIPILVEVCAADDFEYADFGYVGHIPMAPFTTQSGLEVETFKMGKDSKPTMGPSKVAIGERFSSLRQVAKMFSTFTSTYTYSAAEGQTFNPFLVTYRSQGTSLATAPTAPTCTGDVVNLIMSLYGVHFGSMRVQFFYNTTGNTAFRYGTADPTSDIILGNSTTSVYGIRGFAQTNDETADFIIPAFTHDAGRALPAVLVNTNAATPVSPAGVGRSTRALFIRTFAGTGPTGAFYSRQGSDDFNCTHFVSIPVLIWQG